MKRSAELTPLSHDHHQALFTAHRLARATDVSVAPDLLAWWSEDGSRHFRIEEEVLLPAWRSADPAAELALAIRVLTEHLEIRMCLRLGERDGWTVAALNAIGDLMQRHVRFEERELFPLIESRLDEATLAALGAEISLAEGERSCHP